MKNPTSPLRQLLIVVPALVLASGQSLAAEPGLYLGANYGKTSSNVKGSQVANYADVCAVINCSTDDSDKAFSLFGGYRFHRHLAAEIAYVNLGDTAVIGTRSGSVITTTRQETNGLRLAVVGLLPLDRGFTLFGKAGFYRWSSDVSFNNSDGASFSASENGFKPSFGLGAEYSLNRNVSLQLAWDRYTALGKSSGALQSGTGPVKTIDVDADLLSFGVSYRF